MTLSQLRPRVLLFAGPNGSGKSSLTTPSTLVHFGIAPERYINADDIARNLAVELPNASQEEREQEAFRRARALRVTLRRAGEPFAFETVFSHPSTLLDMQACREAGYEVVVLFVTTSDPDINVARVQGRVQAGTGHAVSEDRIRSRYERCMALLPRIVEEAARAFVYDNTGDLPNLFPFENGMPLASATPVPAYLQPRLFSPLVSRRAERDALATRFPNASLPDEATGEYSGPVVASEPHYFVQQTPEKSFVRHDLLLLASGPAAVGRTVRIRYRDGQATWEY